MVFTRGRRWRLAGRAVEARDAGDDDDDDDDAVFCDDYDDDRHYDGAAAAGVVIVAAIDADAEFCGSGSNHFPLGHVSTTEIRFI